MEALIERFETGQLAYEEWHHEQHLRVALHYLMTCPAEAEQRMCQGIQKLNAALDIPQTLTRGYHETLTLAWLRILRARLIEYPAQIERILETCQDQHLLQRHYTKERLNSWEARTGWLEPDLEPLPEPAGTQPQG